MSAIAKLNIEKIRTDFPILGVEVYGKPLVYFDNGATTQKPLSVIKAVEDYYKEYNSNVHRGVHFLSQKARGCQKKSSSIYQCQTRARNYLYKRNYRKY
jgi:cysteine desulfurase/selenocysteine lyase